MPANGRAHPTQMALGAMSCTCSTRCQHRGLDGPPDTNTARIRAHPLRLAMEHTAPLGDTGDPSLDDQFLCHNL